MADDPAGKRGIGKPDRMRQLEILDSIGTTISSDLPLDAIVQQVTDCATELTGAQFGAFFYNVTTDSGESFLLYSLAGAPRSAFEGFGMPRNTAVFEHTFRGVGTVRSDDIRKDTRYGKNDPHHGIPKGHLPVVSYLAVPVQSRSGDIIGGLFFGHADTGVFSANDEDVVQRVAARAASAIDSARLLQSAQRLAAIVESSDDAIISKDLKGIITSWNQGAERIFGYTAKEAIGKPITILIPAEHLNEEPQILERIKRGQRIEHYETIRQRKDGTKFYIALTVSPIRDHSNTIVGAGKIARDISELKSAQEKRELLMREMHHRIKNLFALASGVVAISARGATDAKELARTVQERLNAMAHAHELTMPIGAASLLRPKPALLKELARAVLSPYQVGGEGEVISLSGPDVPVGANAATNIALLLHEVATNSVKYGALSSPEGRVALDWTADGLVSLRWAETGGPPVLGPPQVEGFGGTLSKMTAASLHGTIEREWNPDGLVMRLSVPAAALVH